MGHDALVRRNGAALGVHGPQAERALACVWAVLCKAISEGEIADFPARLPDDLAAYLARFA